jgi:hypothetical protein
LRSTVEILDNESRVLGRIRQISHPLEDDLNTFPPAGPLISHQF